LERVEGPWKDMEAEVVRRAAGTEGTAYVTFGVPVRVPVMPHAGCTTAPPTVAVE
jgi:hypothetical protein